MRALIKTYNYGKVPNSYDLFKGLALAAMIIDHLGFLFFTEELWMRAVGRVAFPVFLFLVGYSGSWRFDPWLLIGAVVVLSSAALHGIAMLPLNILFSILLWRAVMGWLEKREGILDDLLMLWVAMLVFHITLQFLVEYGAMGLMFAVLGWHHRKGRDDRSVRVAWLVTAVLWMYAQASNFEFTGGLLAYYITQSVVMIMLMMQFKPRERPLPPGHTTPSPTWIESLVILSSRNTLLLYVLHLLVFHALAHMLYPERHEQMFKLIQWQ